MEVNLTGIYSKKQVAEILGCTERTIEYYYTLGLPRKQIRSRNYTTGRQLLAFIEEDSESSNENPKLVKFRQECL